MFATGIENSNPRIKNARVRVDQLDSCDHYDRWREDFAKDGEGAIDWLWSPRASVLNVRNEGVPIVGFTWYSLTDQIDWDSALRETNGNVNPVGLFDLDRKIRPVGTAYNELMHEWCTVLPTQSLCLGVPVIWPQEWDEPFAKRRREEARMHRYWVEQAHADAEAGRLMVAA